MVKSVKSCKFYFLGSLELEAFLPKLVEKAFEPKQNILLSFSTLDEIEKYNRILWTYSTITFLPHGGPNDEFPEEQPIYLTCKNNENPNHSKILILCEGNFHHKISLFDQIIAVHKEKTEDAFKQQIEAESEGFSIQHFSYIDGKWSQDNS